MRANLERRWGFNRKMLALSKTRTYMGPVLTLGADTLCSPAFLNQRKPVIQERLSRTLRRAKKALKIKNDNRGL